MSTANQRRKQRYSAAFLLKIILFKLFSLCYNSAKIIVESFATETLGAFEQGRRPKRNFTHERQQEWIFNHMEETPKLPINCPRDEFLKLVPK